MPTYPEDRKKSINYYGVFSLWSSILLFGSYFVLYTSGCGEIASLEIQTILAVSMAAGILMFLLSFCNIAIRLFRVKVVFYLIVSSLVAVSFCVLYVSYLTLGVQCDITLYYARNYPMLKNVTTTTRMASVAETLETLDNRRNDHYTVSAVLDLLAAGFLLASAYSFRIRY